MNNLFSIFDPNVIWIRFELNWVRSIIVLMWMPNVYW